MILALAILFNILGVFFVVKGAIKLVKSAKNDPNPIYTRDLIELIFKRKK